MPPSSAKNTAARKIPHDARFGGRPQTPFCIIIIKTTPKPSPWMPRAPIDTNMPPVLAPRPPPPRRFTAVGRPSPFQKAGRSGKSPVPAFAVKIIDKSPGMASHDDEQQQQQLPPPLHPSSWRQADGPSKRRKGGAGKPAEFQISRKGLASRAPIFFQTPPAGAAAFVVGKKGETSRRPGSCFTIPRRPTCLGTSLLLGRCLQLHAVIHTPGSSQH